MTENEQRRFGITENLLKTKVPTHYGAGEHKVKLAYITEPEAAILKKLDLYDSNPPHEGPGGIPNYNDSGGSGKGPGGGRRGSGPGGTAGGFGNANAGENFGMDLGGAAVAGSGPLSGNPDATTPTAASTAALAAAVTTDEGLSIKDAVDKANEEREKAKTAEQKKKDKEIADAIKAKELQAAKDAFEAEKERAEIERDRQLLSNKMLGIVDPLTGAIDPSKVSPNKNQNVGLMSAKQTMEKLKAAGFTAAQIKAMKAKTYKGLFGDMKTDLSLDGNVVGTLNAIGTDSFLSNYGLPGVTGLVQNFLGMDPGLQTTFNVKTNAQGQEVGPDGQPVRDNQGPTATQPYYAYDPVTGESIDGTDGTGGTGGNLGKNIKKLPADPYNLTYNNSYPAMYNPTGFDNSGYMDYLQNIGAPTNANQSLADLYTAPAQVQNPVPPPFYGPMPMPMPFPNPGPFVPYQTAANGGRIGYDNGGMTGFVDEPISIMYMGDDDVAHSGISGILEKYRQIRSTL